LRQTGAAAYSTREQELPKKAAISGTHGAMAPWQARCIQGYIAVNLHTTIRMMHLTRVVNFSPFRLKRVFKEIFGCTPHQYVIRRRVERAQSLMLMSNDSLSQIAVECGFVGQSHLSNLFHRIVGTRPGAWRRIRTATTRPVFWRGSPISRRASPAARLPGLGP
jgi:AraC family transcriptional regulator